MVDQDAMATMLLVALVGFIFRDIWWDRAVEILNKLRDK